MSTWEMSLTWLFCATLLACGVETPPASEAPDATVNVTDGSEGRPGAQADERAAPLPFKRSPPPPAVDAGDVQRAPTGDDADNPTAQTPQEEEVPAAPSTGDDADNPTAQTLQEEEVPAAPPTTDADVKRVALDQQAFAAALLAQFKGGSDNMILSPYSIHAALAMTAEGARGRTAAQINKTAVLSLGRAQGAAMRGQLDALRAMEVPEDAPRGTPLALRVANRIWVEQSFPLKTAFTQEVAAGHRAAPEGVHFSGGVEGARQTINAWVGQQTLGKIPELIQSGVLNADTRVVLTNALYFKGSWARPFEAYKTRKADFHTLQGETVEVDMMTQTAGFAYEKGRQMDLLVLPYSGQVELLLIMPAKGTFKRTLNQLDAKALQSLMTRKLTYDELALSVPRFTLRSPVSLDTVLKRMGMRLPFNEERADFSAMSPVALKENLHIGKVLHEAFISFNEKGTEAAAATAVVMQRKGVSSWTRPIPFTVDRPFLFVIRDTKHHTPLFVGRVTNPAQE